MLLKFCRKSFPKHNIVPFKLLPGDKATYFRVVIKMMGYVNDKNVALCFSGIKTFSYSHQLDYKFSVPTTC